MFSVRNAVSIAIVLTSVLEIAKSDDQNKLKMSVLRSKKDVGAPAKIKVPVHVNIGGFVKAVQAEFKTFEKKMKRKNKNCLKEIKSIAKIVEKQAQEIKELREQLECARPVCGGNPNPTTPTTPTAPKYQSCTELDCKNKATCEESGGSAKCNCRTGYYGDECEEATLCSAKVPHNRRLPITNNKKVPNNRKTPGKRESESESREVKCQNGGWCMDINASHYEKESSYFCECPPGFHGDLCENGKTPDYSDYEK